ncbi:hypothetical protein ACGFY7_23360 [Streptomyces prunicolor]|uniref:hypothetical protein n=1 Tax=Streptomyces prunicolor TaxID=67348 RepID=UPI003722E56B
MKIRQDIAERLQAGVPQIHICRQLHVAPLTVQRTREAMGLPAPTTRPFLPTTLEAAFRQYTQPTENGHVEWTGPVNNGSPKVVFAGRVHYARRIAFRLHRGRDPIGRVTVAASCEVKDCVAGPCVEDQRIRATNKWADKAFAAIFGEVTA